MNNSQRLSETARSIAFRDFDKQAMREAVFDKLQQKDFVGAGVIIEEINLHPVYKDLVEQLRNQVKKFHEATEQERANQVIEQIEKLFETYSNFFVLFSKEKYSPCVQLNNQWRLPPLISDMISKIFYETQFNSMKEAPKENDPFISPNFLTKDQMIWIQFH